MASLDLANPMLRLSFLPDPLAIVQLPPKQALPASLVAALTAAPSADSSAGLLSITRTATETSLILPWSSHEDLLGPESGTAQPGVSVSGPWVAIQIAGPMDFSLSGILNEMSTPLRMAKVPIFAVSTFDTDYVLVDQKDQDAAREALTVAGWQFAA